MKKAFTLAEILITLTIVGVLSVLLVKNLDYESQMEKTFAPKALKAMEVVNEASYNIRDINNQNCPMGVLIYKNVDTYEQGLINSADGTNMDSTQVRDEYAKYIKFVNTRDFCTNTTYCDSNNEISSIPGGKISGDIYLGFEVTGIQDCPDYYMPGNDNKVVVGNDLKTNAKPKCWAKLYVDVNGKDSPNTEGKDIFIFGLGEQGINQ